MCLKVALVAGVTKTTFFHNDKPSKSTVSKINASMQKGCKSIASTMVQALPVADASKYQALKSSRDQFTNMHEIKTIGQHYVYICPSDWCHQVVYTHKVGHTH